MESEKVKEIKECLEVLNEYGESYITKDKTQRKFVKYADILTLINELESENKELRVVVDIANERTYRKKFTDEWRKEYQKELDKQGNGHIAGFPDFDLVYKLYFEQKDRIAELENTDYYKEIEKKKEELLCKEYGLIKYEKETAGKYLKQFAEKLKETAFRMSTNSNEKFIYAQNVDVILDELLKEYEK